ncbi:uncharacterized protein TRAVEDRAFT_43905 [Trametes versicolor FP-101664 SS1]|uniref:uncharacterized protein n=1 Tax=Trametes versicolor (strain FP-101664) TaxID=717944 RepID=UPI0004621983|nr:uncharacterized protein TRAVEDRAFT_43905 [Trametes versicolor FP-101664 SS1]EIW63622.1 hypothetical protein TRAVEDRAFT_43905 [Trametes versicolor FP-101664 SS1]
MSLSTSTTTTYDLTKYSRAYNQTPSSTQSDQGELQWQHFVNPIIRLTMETRKSLDGHLESYRLKIVWTFSAGLDAMDVDQREVGFEDLDLVAYSSLPSLQTPQGMPLKAVYQEGVVGIRYQHPRIAPPGTTPQYRRFQVVFDSPLAATAFIESIRFICPCKANAPPPPRVAQRASVAQSGYTAPQNSQMPAPSPARPTGRPALKQAMSVAPAPEDNSASAIRRAGTTLSSFATLSDAASNWEVPPAPYYFTQAAQVQAVSVSPAYSSGSGVGSVREDPSYGSSRPSSAVAHHSSSSSGPSPAIPAAAAAAAPTPAHAQPPTPVSVAISVPVSAAAPAATPASSTSTARPPQIQPSTTPLAHTGSSDSLPSSSFPTSSSSPRMRPSSPDLMPPPPVPAIVSRISTPSPAVTQAAVVSAPVLSPVVPIVAPSTAVSTPLEVRAEPATVDSFAGAVPAADIMASLRDSAGLYALPKEELEKLVAEVIREEGFADLMKALDGMWRVKGLAGAV